MSWYEGEIVDTAYGRLVDILDEKLVLNSNWSIYDDFTGFTPGALITNGNFSTLDFTGWTAGTGWSAASGAAVKTSGTASTLTQSITGGVIGYTYKVTFDWTRTAGTLTVTLTNTTGSNAISSGTSGSATYYYYGATSATSVLTFSAGSTFAGSVDNVTVTRCVDNTRVYECDDSGGSGALFYVLVADDNTGFALVELWEGWNATTHAGTGDSRVVFSGTLVLRIYRPAGSYCLSVKDASIRFIDASSARIGTFIGRPDTVLESSVNVVLYCGESSSGGGTYNCISMSRHATYGGWAFLFDEDLNQTLAFDSVSYSSGNAIRKVCQQHDGYFVLYPCMVVNDTTKYLVGFLDDVVNFGELTSTSYLRNGQKIIADGYTWIVFGGQSYCSAFRMD